MDPRQGVLVGDDARDRVCWVCMTPQGPEPEQRALHRDRDGQCHSSGCGGTGVAIVLAQEAAMKARRFGRVLVWGLVFGGCVSDVGGGRSLGRTDYGSGSFALENSSGEQGVIRMGDALRMYAAPGDLDLRPGHKYHFQVTNVSADTTVSEGDVSTREDGSLPPTTLAHDLGDMPGTTEQEDDTLKVDFWDPDAAADHLEAFIPLLRVPALQGGWNVEEVDPPHVYATDATETPTNAFAVSDNGDLDPGEIAGPVYVGGEGLPSGAVVDVYLMRDQDEWQGLPIPQAGSAEHVAGPVQVTVREDGTLPRTLLWEPQVGSVGVYDVVVDVDQNGIFDWDFSNKDGADGEAKVGVTIQYSQSWVRARRINHLIMNIAFGDSSRRGQWTNSYLGSDDLYLYVNPDVTARPDLNHKFVYKWIVRHQDFDTFWNDPMREDPDGCIDFGEHILGDFAGPGGGDDDDELGVFGGGGGFGGFQVPAQAGCTNAAPLNVGAADNISGTGNGPGEYDVVFTYIHRNGAQPRYCPGTDILDIVSQDTSEVLIEDIANVPLEQRVGFTVR